MNSCDFKRVEMKTLRFILNCMTAEKISTTWIKLNQAGIRINIFKTYTDFLKLNIQKYEVKYELNLMLRTI